VRAGERVFVFECEIWCVPACTHGVYVMIFDKVSLLAILTLTMTQSDTHVNAGADKSFSTRTKTGCEAKTFIIGIPVGRFNVCTMHRRAHARTHTHSCTHASIVEKLCKYDDMAG